MPESSAIDIFNNSANQTANIGIDDSVTTAYDVYVNSWYLESTSSQPYARVNYYIGPNTQTSWFTNPVGYTSNDKTKPYFKNDTSPSWTIGWGTPECKWSVPKGWFNFNSNILASGNNQVYSDKYEKIAFQFVRWSASDNDWGDVWIKRYARMKPYGKVSVTLSSDFGTVTKKNPDLKITCKFNDNVNDYLPGMTDYHYCKIEILNTSLEPYYVKRVVNGNTVWTMPQNVFNSLTTGTYYSIKITPGFYRNSTFYSYSDRSITKNNCIMRDPTPQAASLVVNPSTLGTIKNMSASFEFYYQGVGVLNRLKLELQDRSNPNASKIPVFDRSAHLGGKMSASINMADLMFNAWYKLIITTYYDDNNKTSREIDYFIQSFPQPTKQPSNFKVNGSSSLSGFNPYNKESITFSWNYDNTSNTQKTSGIANAYYIELIDVNNNEVVHNKLIEGLSYSNSGSSYAINVNTPTFIGKLLKVKITPQFIEKVGYPYKARNVIGGSNPYTTEAFLFINYGLQEIGMVAPLDTTAEWFDCDPTVSTDYPQFKIAFQLPYDDNYKYLGDQQASYRYSDLTITYKGASTITKSYSYADRSNQHWICVTGTGELTHQNTVMIDLKGVSDNGLRPDSNNKYEITISVSSPYSSSRELKYTINIVDFPITRSIYDPDDQSWSEVNYTGTHITAAHLNEFVTASRIVNTFTGYNSLLPNFVNEGDYIEYASFKYVIQPIIDLYNKTKGWNNAKKYKAPMTILNGIEGTSEGQLRYDVTPGNKGKDHVYGVQFNKGGVLSEKLASVPGDYSTNYNNYFQQSEDYVFRSKNSSIKITNDGFLPDLHTTSTGDYNVFFSYYLLFRKLATNTYIEPRDLWIYQTTAAWSGGDSSTYGGWVDIPDIQLKSTYSYEIEAEMVTNDLPTERCMTLFGGSFDNYNHGINKNGYQGLFCSTGTTDTDLHMFNVGVGYAENNIATPIEITDTRKVYRFTNLNNVSYIASMSEAWDSTIRPSYVYIPIELYSDYSYEVTTELGTIGGRKFCILGGSCSTGDTYIAFQSGTELVHVANDSIINTLSKVSGVSTYIFPGNSSHTQCTDGGFFLMGIRDYQTGEPASSGYGSPDAFYSHAGGYVYRVAIKDANDDVIMDFVPTVSNGHKGFIDLVSNTFYASADDSKFFVSTEDRTSNGFMILAAKNYSLQEGKITSGLAIVDSAYYNYCHGVYRLTIYDENNTVIHNFVPDKDQNDNFGMTDTSTGTFYPGKSNAYIDISGTWGGGSGM